MVETIKSSITFIIFSTCFIAACTCKAYFWHEISTQAFLAVSQGVPLLLRAWPEERPSQTPFKNHLNHQIKQSILLEVPYKKWSAAPRLFILVDARVLNRRTNVNKHKRPGARYWCTRLRISHRLALMNLLKLRSHRYLARSLSL